MPILEEHAIDIHWTDCLKRIEGLEVNKHNRITVHRDIIPIIFIPGIMGTKLRIKNPTEHSPKGGKAWDPDDEEFIEEYYFKDTDHGLTRQRLLIGGEPKHDPEHLDVLYPNSLKPDAADLGWDNLFNGGYGTLKNELNSYKAPVPIEYCFEYVAHAFGYNWTACNSVSGAKLKDYIDKIIEHYDNLENSACERVILITHSMGGLVARSACQQGAESNVLGVIHGVQPVNGSPATYWRMKAGFAMFAGKHDASGTIEHDNFAKSLWYNTKDSIHNAIKKSQQHLETRVDNIFHRLDNIGNVWKSNQAQLAEKLKLSVVSKLNGLRAFIRFNLAEAAKHNYQAVINDVEQLSLLTKSVGQSVKELLAYTTVDNLNSINAEVQQLQADSIAIAEQLQGAAKVFVIPSVLGPTGAYVTSVLAFMPGALELLPTQAYRNNQGDSAWLSFSIGEREGQVTTLPQSDPYSEIYSEREKFYRLIEPQWLVPKIDFDSHHEKEQAIEEAWKQYDLCLDEAKGFHDTLAHYMHPMTYQFYTSDVITPDHIEYKRSTIIKQKYDHASENYVAREKELLKALVAIKYGDFYKGHAEHQELLAELELISRLKREKNTGKRAKFNGYSDAMGHAITPDGKHDYYAHQLAYPKGRGDGTVPISSASALAVEAKRDRQFDESLLHWREQDHEGVYKTKPVLQAIRVALANLGVNWFHQVREKIKS